METGPDHNGATPAGGESGGRHTVRLRGGQSRARHPAKPMRIKAKLPTSHAQKAPITALNPMLPDVGPLRRESEGKLFVHSLTWAWGPSRPRPAAPGGPRPADSASAILGRRRPGLRRVGRWLPGTPATRPEPGRRDPRLRLASRTPTPRAKPRRAIRSRDAQAATRKPLRASRDAQAAMPKPRAQAASCDCVWRAAIRSREPTAGQRPRQPASRLSSSRTEPFLESGSLPLPHLGDWMQDGQPAWHSQLRMASAVARSHSAAAW